MAAYHVFVDGAVDSSDSGGERLAQAIADHYGLPVEQLRARIASGRFRVKGNCDRATAESYANDLTRLGATCSIEEATPSNHALTPLPFPAVVVAPSPSPSPPKPALAPQLAPKPSGRPTSPPSALASAPSTAGNYQSGLAAAFAGDAAGAGNLGALESENVTFTLAALDGGADAPSPAPHSFAPPPTGAEPSASTSAPSAKQSQSQTPIDMFAPPDEGESSLSVDLAPDEAERTARKRTSAPPVNEVAAPPPPEAGRHSRASLAAPVSEPARYSRPSLAAPNARASERSQHPLANEKVRFVAGVVIALVIGFIPAHIVASSREKTAFAAIDANVVAIQKQAETAEAYAALDQFRTEQLARKADDRRSIAMMALLIWGIAGGAIAYVWFRRIPWPPPVEQ